MFDPVCPRPSGPRSPGHTAARRLMLAGCAALALAAFGTTIQAQTYFPTATKRADLQVGGGYTLARPDYSNNRFSGITGYGTFDVSPHYGIEFIFHQLNTHGDDGIYERTYEIGPRYVRHYGRYHPFVRATYGRGVFNFPLGYANLAYNIVGGAGGVDIRVQRHLNVRAEFEAQYWLKFGDDGLQPDAVTLGAAYHF